MTTVRLEKQALRRRWRELRTLVNEWDPLGLISVGCPEDEYECLVGPLMRRLEEGVSREDVASFLAREFREHFGCEGPDAKSTANFVAKARAWFAGEGRGSRV